MLLAWGKEKIRPNTVIDPPKSASNRRPPALCHWGQQNETRFGSGAKKSFLLFDQRKKRCKLAPRTHAPRDRPRWVGLLYRDLVSGGGGGVLRGGRSCARCARSQGLGAASLHAACRRHLKLQWAAQRFRTGPGSWGVRWSFLVKNSGMKRRVWGLCTWN